MAKHIQKWLPCEITGCTQKVNARFVKKTQQGESNYIRKQKWVFPTTLCITHQQQFDNQMEEVIQYMAKQQQEKQDMLNTMIVKKNKV